MSSRNTPKPNSLNGKRLKRVTQRRAYFAQAGVTIELVQHFDALLEKAGVRVAPEDWEVAIESALLNYPIDTSRPVALAAIAASYAATLNNRAHGASAAFRVLATALSGTPIQAWVFDQRNGDHVMPLGGVSLDVIDEACRTVADHPAWGVLGAARSVYLVASRQVTQMVDELVLRDIVGADDDAARDVLGGEVSRFAVSLAKDIGIPWKAGASNDLPVAKIEIALYDDLIDRAKEAGAWPWDEVLAKHLEATGTTGTEAAAKIRAASQENMARALAGDSKVGKHAGHGAMLRFWNDPSFEPLGLRWLSQVALSLWHDKVKPERDRAMEAERALGEKRERKPASLVRVVVADQLIPAMSKQLVFSEYDDGVIRDQAGKPIGSIAVADGLSLEQARKSIEAFGTVTGQRALRGLIHQSHTAWLQGDQNPTHVTYEGGWSTMCEAIEVSPSGANIATLQQLAAAGQAIQWSSKHYEGGGLWTWSASRGGGQRQGSVQFRLGAPLTPGLGAEMRGTKQNSGAARTARRLVPELRLEPPMGGARGNDQGAVWILQRLFVVELVDHSIDLHTDGAVVIPEAKWRQMAASAGLPTNRIAATLDAWAAGESDKAPALITRTERDGFTLADPHAPERDFIAAGGAKVLASREAATKSVRARRSKPNS